MQTRLRPARISVHLQHEIDEYINEKKHETDMENHVARNTQKKKTFELIKKHYDNNTLTANKLIDILSALTLAETEYLFSVGVFSDEASTDSKAAKFIVSLFEELAVPFSLEKIVAGELSLELAANYKQAIFRQIVSDWQTNPYDQTAKNRLDHELWEVIFLKDDFFGTIELSQVKNVDHENVDHEKDKWLSGIFFGLIGNIVFISRLYKLQGICPAYLAELLAEVTQHCCDSGDYQEYLAAVLDIIKNEKENASGLTNYFLHCHQRLATDIIKVYPDKFFELDSAMQAKVHEDLLLEARYSGSIEALERITEAAARILNAQDDEEIFPPSDKSSSDSISTSTTSTTTTQSSVEHIIITGVSNRLFDNKQSEIDAIYQIIKDDVQLNRSEDEIKKVVQEIEVVQEIDIYRHSSDVKKAKADFFSNLLDRVDGGEELNLELIHSCLSELNPEQRAELFEKWLGFGAGEESRAAQFLAKLYHSVTGVALTKAQMQTMVRDGVLPNLKSEIEKVVRNPLHKPAILGKNILAAHKKLHDAKSILQRMNANKLAAKEAEYENNLVQNGFDQSLELAEKGELRFDTQGRIFVEARCPDVDNKLTKHAICSLDVKNNLDLATNFVAWVASDVDLTKEIALTKVAKALFELPSRSSIIPLHEEMEMHMRLASRVLEKTVYFNMEVNVDWDLIRHKAAIKINDEVKKIFQQALLAASSVTETEEEKIIIDVAILNEKLAAARKNLAFFSRQALMEELLIADVDGAEIENIIYNIDEHAFERTTATGMEYIRTDEDLKSCVRFSDTEETAHDKKEWSAFNSFATREIHRNDFINGEVRQAKRTRVELRVPSIAVIKMNRDDAVIKMNRDDSVRDVADKLKENYERLQKKLGGYDGSMTYNLLTALNFTFFDITYDFANRQRESAVRILKGTHVFNRAQILSGKPNSLCFVENISVNQQGINLNYDRLDNAALEAMLMCDLAMLNNFNTHRSCLPPAMRQYIKKMYAKAYMEYNHFLQNNEQGNLYFKDSIEGKYLIEQMKHFKEVLKHNASGLQFDPGAPLAETAMKALMKIVAMDKHGKKSYGPLVQSLSIYIETAAQHGCKSANERDAIISNTVDLIGSIEKVDQENDARLEVLAALQSFLDTHDKNDKHRLKHVRDHLNKALNIFNLYGPLVSHEDQGASIKIEASVPRMIGSVDFNSASKGKLGLFDRLDTNIALPREFTNLDSTGVSAMQAHKGDHQVELKTALEKADSKLREGKQILRK